MPLPYITKMIEKESSISKHKKIKVVDVALTTVGILLLSLTTVLVISRFISKDRLVFGFRSDIVLTDSMSTINDEVKEQYIQNGWDNQLAVHDWIFTTKVNEEDLNIGDIVTYNNPIAGVTTHRIVGIKEFYGIKYYTIRADGAKAADKDGDFKYEAIIGKVTHNAGQFGQVIYFLQTIYGTIMLVGLAMICFLYSFFSDRIEKKNKDGKIN